MLWRPAGKDPRTGTAGFAPPPRALGRGCGHRPHSSGGGGRGQSYPVPMYQAGAGGGGGGGGGGSPPMGIGEGGVVHSPGGDQSEWSWERQPVLGGEGVEEMVRR